MRLRSSLPPLPRLLFLVLLRPLSPSRTCRLSCSFSLSTLALPPSLPPQRRHRLRRPPLNQVSDYLLEIDFTCSARFCICTSAPVRRTSAIVLDVTGASPFRLVLVLLFVLAFILVLVFVRMLSSSSSSTALLLVRRCQYRFRLRGDL